MLYTYEHGILEEYEVEVDKEKLKKVKNSIIYNCSYIEHCKGVFASIMPYYDKTKSIILDMEMINLAYVQENMGWPDTSYYNYKYNKYYFPKIVNIINEILDGNEDKIQNLFEKENTKITIEEDSESDVNTLKETIDLINKYIETNDKGKLEYAVVKLSSFKHRNIDDPKKTVEEYYLELKSCFEFRKINGSTEDDLNKIKEIFGDDWENKITKVIERENNVRNSVSKNLVKTMMKK